jgi:5'-methylthioadenosine phosphorylase
MSELKIGLIGGTGLGEAVLRGHAGVRHEVQTPFGPPSDAIIEAEWEGVPVFLLARHGPGHTIPPSQINSRANIFALKQLGVTHILASGAVGSLREELRPRDLVVPDQVIDKTFRRPGTFYERTAVHVELAEPFCPVLRRILLEAAVGRDGGPDAASPEPRRQDTQAPSGELSPPGQPVPSESSPEPRPLSPGRAAYTVHDRGCYVCMEGPAFSTRAESLMHRLWGGDLIGMTAMPEARLAREAEIPYVLLALVTDYDCWRVPRPKDPPGAGREAEQLLAEILANLQSAAASATDLLRRAVRLMAGRVDELMACPARSALKLAIWSDKSRIDPGEVQRLAPLWMKYMEPPPPVDQA